MLHKLLASAALLVAFAAPAHAVLQLTVNANGQTFTCSDGEASCDLNGGANNLLVVDTAVGGGFVELILAQSTFGPGKDELQLSSSAISNTTNAPITFNIAASDNGFTPPVHSINESASLTFNNAIGSGPSSLAFLASQSNTKFVGQSLFTTSGTPVTEPDSFSGTHTSVFDSLTPFSMTEAARHQSRCGRVGDRLQRGDGDRRDPRAEDMGDACLGLCRHGGDRLQA